MGQPNDGKPADPKAKAPDPPAYEPQGGPPVGTVTPQLNMPAPGHLVLDLQGGGGAGNPPGFVINSNIGTFNRGAWSGSATFGVGTGGFSASHQTSVVLKSSDTRQFGLYMVGGASAGPAGIAPTAGVGVEGDLGGNHPQRPRVQLGAYINGGPSVYTNLGGTPAAPGTTAGLVNVSGIGIVNLGKFDFHANPPFTLAGEIKYGGVYARGTDGRPLATETVAGTVSVNKNWTLADGSVVVRAGVAGTLGNEHDTAGGKGTNALTWGVMAGASVSLGTKAKNPTEEAQRRAEAAGRTYDITYDGQERKTPFQATGTIKSIDGDRITLVDAGQREFSVNASDLRRGSFDVARLNESLQPKHKLTIDIAADGWNRVDDVTPGQAKDKSKAVEAPAR